MDYEKIKKLVSLVEQNRLSELAIEEDELSIVIKAEEARPAAVSAPTAQSNMSIEIQPCEAPMLLPDMVEVVEETQAASESLVYIESPMVGVFYRNPAPDSPSFVDIGDEVEEGQTLGLIEAMKVFSEVPSEVSGIVVEIPVETGKLVQQGDVLVVIDTSVSGE